MAIKSVKESKSVEESGAFVETFSLETTSEGLLRGLRFGVKDLIDVAGYPTACGNPSWRDSHPPATVHAVAVEQLLAAGGLCVGKTVTDELAFSLIGENHFDGTPLNPAAPTRVPGGSSSGSASAVACGLADFALGTDTGGSVRVPSSNCGVWGLRPSHGIISVAGVMPFAPTFDTLGVLACSGEVMQRVASVLLASAPVPDARPAAIYLVDETWALVDPEVRQALQDPLQRLRTLFGKQVQTTSLSRLCGAGGEGGFDTLLETYCVLQWAEIGSSLGAWIATTEPKFGPATTASFELVHKLDRSRVGPATERREAIYRHLRSAIGEHDLLCIPTVTGSAPEKGAILGGRTGDYYRRALSLTSLAGLGRLPQVSLPLGSTEASPIGLSLIASHGQDMFLLAVAAQLENSTLA